MDFSRDGLLAILQNFYKKEVKIAYDFTLQNYKYYKTNIKTLKEFTKIQIVRMGKN